MRKRMAVAMLVAGAVFGAAMPGCGPGDASKNQLLTTIKSRGALRIGFEPAYQPFEIKDTKTGKFHGFDIELGDLIANELGVKAERIESPWDGIFVRLANREFDIILSGATIKPDRAKQIDFTNPYVHTGQAILLARKHEGTITEFAQLNDAKYTLVSQTGTTGWSAIAESFPKAKARAYKSASQAATEVLQGNVDALVYDLPFLKAFHATHPGAVLLPKPFTEEDLGIGVPKNEPALLAELNRILAKFKADGTIERLKDKYLRSLDWLEGLNVND